MATQTTTQSQSQQQPPSYKSLSRLSQVPLISQTLSTLRSNAYTSYPYAVSVKAYEITTPIQLRLAPVLSRADEYADYGLGRVQERYPYPFEKDGGEMVRDFRGASDKAVGKASELAGNLDSVSRFSLSFNPLR